VLYPLSYEGIPPIVGHLKLPRGRFRAARSLHPSRLDRHKPTVLLLRSTLSLFDLSARERKHAPTEVAEGARDCLWSQGVDMKGPPPEQGSLPC